MSSQYLRLSSISRFSAECDRLVPPVPNTRLTFVRTKRRAVSVNLHVHGLDQGNSFWNGERNVWSNKPPQTKIYVFQGGSRRGEEENENFESIFVMIKYVIIHHQRVLVTQLIKQWQHYQQYVKGLSQDANLPITINRAVID